MGSGSRSRSRISRVDPARKERGVQDGARGARTGIEGRGLELEINGTAASCFAAAP